MHYIAFPYFMEIHNKNYSNLSNTGIGLLTS
jgi:hypothetical protein